MVNPPITDTKASPARLFPTVERPVRVVARNLAADELLRAHQHPWAQVTYALDGYYQRIGTKVFLFTPSNTVISVEDDLDQEQRTLFFDQE